MSESYGAGSGFALIVVLFILLVIVGTAYVGGFGGAAGYGPAYGAGYGGAGYGPGYGGPGWGW
ncbi:MULTISPECIES: YjcZ family sporulation protein [unclassified Virgibacillus]|uniref:YjcZ family sporulation protein n=1 Tax=unclassified Virgibacillus TaxID=2620237 RepID=UPI0024DE2DEB|nr:YjcZ family sporulation protein [Virgibacillus sp. LDC-1]